MRTAVAPFCGVAAARARRFVEGGATPPSLRLEGRVPPIQCSVTYAVQS